MRTFFVVFCAILAAAIVIWVVGSAVSNTRETTKATEKLNQSTARADYYLRLTKQSPRPTP